MPDRQLVREKVKQTADVLEETGTDLWLTYCRETTEIDEPCLPFLLGFDVVWPTMVLISKDGDKATIIGSHDAQNVDSLGVYDVYPYEASLEEPFLDLLKKIDPDEIAVNYAEDNTIADGLTHGMFRRLEALLEGTEYEGSLVSADEVITRLRSDKSPIERDRMIRAGEITTDLFEEVTNQWEPDWTEADVAEYVHDRMHEQGLESAWSWDYCPTVHAGSDSALGHTMPSDTVLRPGQVLHMDFGVKYEGYATDIQRLYYYPTEDERKIPEDLQAAFEDVRAAIDAAFETLKPGVRGHEVDAAARAEITDRNWPEYSHAVGHNVGRNAHDGGTLLGPLWERYGESPNGTVREGEIYTLELGIETDYGYLGQEEMVVVTEDGAEWFLDPQTELRRLEV
ncbi:Xaa-Pro peptidase family protein [Halogeometricum sp. CBA1124]|uniref:M24 family metallopeptidase n=1 Tax=Halogeometricum sp. CBA1124 TaxID=2668071 RepID=UPI00142BE5FA|nr:M24 family metallopeptidase [Halogeometricum sp. CBA1124]MUV58530.1 M24 family metallopeptidase [Halogeometricum sp. CBA1124]